MCSLPISCSLARWLLAAQLLNIETTKNQQQLFAALKEGNKAMKDMQQVGARASFEHREDVGPGS